MIRLAIVDDDRLLLDLLRRVFEGQPDFTLMGLFGTAEEALREADWQQTDVLLSDLDLPGMSGIGLIATVLEANPRVVALAYTIHEHRESLFAALRAGASGYVLKGLSPEELRVAVRRVKSGGSPISPAIARYLIREFPVGGTKEEECALSVREREILRLVASGRIYKEISDMLSISTHTVQTHVKNIYGKLHAANRGEAIRFAKSRGYLDLK